MGIQDYTIEEREILNEYLEPYLKPYLSDEDKKLKKMTNEILVKLKYHDVNRDDFVSLAHEIIVKAMYDYDFIQDFDGYIYSCLEKKFKTEMTRLNRQKRQADKMALSWETPIGDEDGNSTLGDMIASNINIEKEILGDDSDIIMDEKIERYFGSLSKIQRKIIEMKMQNVEVQNIKKELGLTDSQYSSHIQEVVQYEHIRLLHI